MSGLLRRVILLAALCLPSAALAQAEGQIEVPRGLWETEPDFAGVILHVRTRRCGNALCGRVERAKNRAGFDAPSNAVGDKVLWEMRAQPDGSFFGEYRGPRAHRYLQSRATVVGRELRLEVCDEEKCSAQVWQRIR
ncbi:hypothetical protein AB2B41_17255 [Marimonas sp. MJW-29]|uniref:DUF2147 domain-containing protein n=1 Tax=Sulfitobacter sediminis TaxID=3234186 RepID=A0ABV3RRR4_9RHOB